MSFDRNILQQIYDEEETDNFIYSIREELMSRVMKECYKIYLEKQTIRFVVQCAYDALVRFLSFQFYYHHPVPNVKDPTWTPDSHVEPSPKDTWSAGAIPVRLPKVPEEEQDDDAVEKKKDIDLFPCTCPKVIECVCADPDTVLIEKWNKHYSAHEIINVTPTETKRSDEDTDQIAMPSRQTTEDELNVTMIESNATTSAGDLKPKRKKEKQMMRDVKQEIPEPGRRGSQASVVKLPPIRVSTKLQTKLNEQKKKKKQQY
ncbi:hypothetical protein GWI33_007539 [Rhynchophorus ferrugineus]|uniref:Uncharacterized protein n=1 Tax=Rhynchophorus ferrugineus TaxID=354439 RepID=A0A834IE55_RHYFE|nr:hypothetical protein GWI33_007539 [Rhynchophorus ferrugineus]